MDDNGVEWVDLTMSPEELAEYVRTHDEWVIHLDHTWTAESLAELYPRGGGEIPPPWRLYPN